MIVVTAWGYASDIKGSFFNKEHFVVLAQQTTKRASQACWWNP